jgi:hypothetical protein
MSSVPFERFEPPKLGTDDVGRPLDGTTPIWFENSGTGGMTNLSEEREVFWLRRYVVSKLKITTTIRAKVATIPVKRTVDDLTVDLEELIDVFPR